MKHQYLCILFIIFLIPTLSSCGGGSDSDAVADDTIPLSYSTRVQCALNANEECLEIELPCFDKNKLNNSNERVLYRDNWYDEECEPETIQIPNHRPVYAFLVNGFHQNRNLDMFHFYNYAKCLQAKDAYVHFAWWNNLLAPYMQKPLHNDDSQPSHTANPWWLEGRTDGSPHPGNIDQPRKATPRDDYQFQEDAERVLLAIREANHEAKIILVGHSMGGDAITRLATANTDIRNIDIALVAPIDPVGNRSCLRPAPGGQCNWLNNCYLCKSFDNFTRAQITTIDETFRSSPHPERRNFGTNINYLYYRFQREFKPPFDYQRFGPFFSYHGAEGTHTDDRDINSAIAADTTSIQSQSPTSPNSYLDIPHWRRGYGGGDGHGEMVGFRGAILPFGPNVAHIFYPESWPLALYAGSNWATTDPLNIWGRIRPGWPVLDWPSRDTHPCPGGPEGAVGCARVEHLKSWETDPNYLATNGFEPYNPNLCAVSPHLCNVLDKIVNMPPVANAGQDQTVECSAPTTTEVSLDGSGSSDSDGDSLNYTWEWPLGTVTGERPYADFPLGTHTVTLTVSDGELTDTDTVDITVQDITAPTLNVSLSPNVLWPPNHKLVKVTASIDASDTCDVSPTVKLVSITSNEPDDGKGDGHKGTDIQGAEFGTDDREFLLRAERSGKVTDRIYTVTYEATDASGNVVVASAKVTVLHDHSKNK